MEVRLNKSNNNPFYGLKKCLGLFQNTGGTITEKMLDDAWMEVCDDLEKRKMFFSLLFSVGDITNRQHNIFKGIKKDSGGNANREGFYTILEWMKKEGHMTQFMKFMNAGLFNEYSCFDFLFMSRVKTKKGKVTATYDMFADDLYCKALLRYVYSIINGNNPFNKMLVAKFLTPPRLSKRSGHTKMMPVTHGIMLHKARFLEELSKLMYWEYTLKGEYANFKGYRQWRKQYNGSLESVLFSTGKIKEFDKTQFLDWYDKLPSQARFRVKNRILHSKNTVLDPEGKPMAKEDSPAKWPNLAPWVKEWEDYKEKKQAEQRVLEEKVRQGEANTDDLAKLEKVKKEAKVNIGATSFNELYDQIMSGRVDTLKLESFIQNKVNLPYNSLVIIDDSGSMDGRPFHLASFLASVCLVKNPDDDARNLVGLFGRTGRWFSYIDKVTRNSYNSLLRREIGKTMHEPIVDPSKSFMDNYRRINSFLNAEFGGGWTDITTILSSLEKGLECNPQLVESLKSYPVWTIISDGEWNNMRSPEASINDFFRKCEMILGFKPFIVAIDVTRSNSINADRFSGIDNMIYIPSNPAQIEQFLTNFKDMDVFDVYTPLQSLYRSNRYELIREHTL